MANLTKSLVMPNGQEYEFVGKHWYGTCTTAAATRDKTVSITGFTNADMSDGVQITVYFTNAQTYNGTPRIYLGGSYINIYTSYNVVAGQYEWAAGAIITFVKQGSRWVIIDGDHATTTYWGKVKLNGDLYDAANASHNDAATSMAVRLYAPRIVIYGFTDYDTANDAAAYRNCIFVYSTNHNGDNSIGGTTGFFTYNGKYAVGFFSSIGSSYHLFCVDEDDDWHDLGTTTYQTTANLVTSISSASTDAQYPSAKLLYDTVGDIETLLASI